MAEPPRTSPRPRFLGRVRVTTASVLLLIGTLLVTYAAWNVLTSAYRVIGWVVAGAVVAILLEPVVEALGRHMPRLLALVLVLLVLLGFMGFVGYRVFDDLRQQGDNLRRELPEAAADLEARSELARDFELEQRVRDLIDDLPQQLTGGTQQVVTSAADRVGTFLVSGILMIFLLLYGERMIEGGLSQIADPARRTEIAGYVQRARTVGRRYLVSTLAKIVGYGLVAWAVCRVVDLPAPSALALVIGVLAAIPLLGIVVGAIPAFLLAGADSTERLLVVLVIFVGLQVLDGLVVQPAIDRRSLSVGAGVITITALVGLDTYGFGGAIVGTAVAVLALSVLDTVATPDPPLVEAG